MKSTPDKYQKLCLNLLLDAYEKSATYKGTNKVRQNFSIKPSQIFREYHKDTADVEQVKAFEESMRELQHQGLVELFWPREIERITATGNWEKMYLLIGRTELKEREKQQMEFYSGYLDGLDSIARFAADQILRLEQHKKPVYETEYARQILRLWAFVLQNTEELLERELSILVFADSKAFEKLYRSRLLGLLKTYEEGGDAWKAAGNESEQNETLLDHYHIHKNPDYIYLRGNATLFFKDGRSWQVREPFALSRSALEQLERVQTDARRILSVENLTSFHRLEEPDTLQIYLAGYPNTLKASFLKMVHEQNPDLPLQHFGDLDPDGFWILETLKSRTRLDIAPWQMDADLLDTYASSCRKLEENDRKKADSLLQQGKYTDILQKMLKEDRKLEQEILSLHIQKSS